jgi:hypothetical protein
LGDDFVECGHIEQSSPVVVWVWVIAPASAWLGW